MVDTVGGLLRGSIAKNRPSHHTISVSQSDFCESHTWRLVSLKALRELNALWALPLYPTIENEKSNGKAEKSHKKFNRNIIATNFV